MKRRENNDPSTFFVLSFSGGGTRAAATSSAVPVALSPMTLNNYGGNCNYQYPAWVRDAVEADADTQPSARAMARYREMQKLQDSTNHPYLHLVDGGVADNQNNWDKCEKPPNRFKQTLQSSGVPIARYTFDTVELMRQSPDYQEVISQIGAELIEQEPPTT